MIHRALGTLVTLGAVLFVLAMPATAQAAQCPNPFWGIYCPTAYLHTPYGPVARATQVSGDGRARYGNFSLLTGEFLPNTPWMPIYEEKAYLIENVRGSDGQWGNVSGYASVNTPYGATLWGTQVAHFGTLGWLGRWGTYNLLTKLFYPEGGWTAADPY